MASAWSASSSVAAWVAALVGDAACLVRFLALAEHVVGGVGAAHRACALDSCAVHEEPQVVDGLERELMEFVDVRMIMVLRGHCRRLELRQPPWHVTPFVDGDVGQIPDAECQLEVRNGLLLVVAGDAANADADGSGDLRGRPRRRGSDCGGGSDGGGSGVLGELVCVRSGRRSYFAPLFGVVNVVATSAVNASPLSWP